MVLVDMGQSVLDKILLSILGLMLLFAREWIKSMKSAMSECVQRDKKCREEMAGIMRRMDTAGIP